jgi:hypothetical protein
MLLAVTATSRVLSAIQPWSLSSSHLESKISPAVDILYTSALIEHLCTLPDGIDNTIYQAAQHAKTQFEQQAKIHHLMSGDNKLLITIAPDDLTPLEDAICQMEESAAQDDPLVCNQLTKWSRAALIRIARQSELYIQNKSDIVSLAHTIEIGTQAYIDCTCALIGILDAQSYLQENTTDNTRH